MSEPYGYLVENGRDVFCWTLAHAKEQQRDYGGDIVPLFRLVRPVDVVIETHHTHGPRMTLDGLDVPVAQITVHTAPMPAGYAPSSGAKLV